MKEPEGHVWQRLSRKELRGLSPDLQSYLGVWTCSKCGVRAEQQSLRLSPKLKVRRKKGSLTKSPSLVMKPTKKGIEQYEYYSCEEWRAIQDVEYVHGL